MSNEQNKNLCEPMRSVSVALLMLAAPCGEATPLEELSVSREPTLDVHVQDNQSAAQTPRLWRSVTLNQGATQQDYRETDPFGRVNPLNIETGSVPTTELILRWRGQAVAALPEFVLQANVSYAQGQTDYNGYLQQGITLTPYSARTGNTLQALSLRIGLPLNALTRQPWAQHIAPYAEQGWHRWQRKLVQYGETFDWQTTTLGVMAVWPLAELGLPQLVDYTLEVDLSVGRSRNPRIEAPAMGFAAELGETGLQSATLALHYAVTPAWLLGIRYATQRSTFGASASVGGLQYPGSSNGEQNLAIGLGYHF